MREALAIVSSEGLPALWERHLMVHKALWRVRSAVCACQLWHHSGRQDPKHLHALCRVLGAWDWNHSWRRRRTASSQ